MQRVHTTASRYLLAFAIKIVLDKCFIILPRERQVQVLGDAPRDLRGAGA